MQVAMPRRFRNSRRVLLESAEADDEDPTEVRSAAWRLQSVLEANIALLARAKDNQNRAAEALRLVDAIRARSVQSAISASAARSAARTPALADLVRKEQDLKKQVGALATTVGNVLGDAPEQRQAILK